MIRLSLIICTLSFSLSSCVDTIIIPDSMTVEEDYWKTKDDVSMMVNGAYQSMTDAELMFRLILWSEFRSDDVILSTGVPSNSTVEQLEQIEAQHIETDNIYNKWERLYTVINNCNIVLEKAGQVVEIDPDYTENDYVTDRSQMLALRSLCYFYLVRTFRDVPYYNTAYLNSSQEMSIPQQSPDSVLNACLADLEEAYKTGITPDAYRSPQWQHCGLINKNAIKAIMADIYLWRASVNHSAADYQKCIDCCDEIIAEKKKTYSTKIPTFFSKQALAPLATYREAFSDIFIDQNSMESILELQFNGINNSNTSLCQAYHKFAGNGSPVGYFQASPLFGNQGSEIWKNVKSDHRFFENVYEAGEDNPAYDIRKMIAESNPFAYGDPASAKGEKRVSRTYAEFKQNFIFYRLTDIMLMKAEALVQLAASDTDPLLSSALELVQNVNNRSLYATAATIATDTLSSATYNTIAKMEELVLQERQRELCFEGKRWFDLMRYNYRHITAADYTKTMGQLMEENGGSYTFPDNYAPMLQLAARGLTSGQASVVARMRYETNLYMPVYRKEMDVNPRLVQNPAYSDVDEYERTN